MPKKKQLKVVTPIGTAQYAWIARADVGHEYSDGKFKCTLLMNPSEPGVQDLVDNIEAEIKKAAIAEWGKLPKVLRSPIKSGDDIADEKDDKEEWRGMLVLTSKSKYQPGLIDAQRNELAPNVFVRSGDTIRLSAALIPYIVAGVKGVSLQLRTIQLLAQRPVVESFDNTEGYSTDLVPSKNYEHNNKPQANEPQANEPNDNRGEDDEPEDF